MTAHLTTHVLDTTGGTPAAGVAVTLRHASGEAIAEAVTDADGRAGLGPELLPPGAYALTFPAAQPVRILDLSGQLRPA